VKRLVPTLDALEHQNVPSDLPWEILLVDNDSTDDTFKVADEFRKKLKKNIEFRIIYEPALGKSNALVRGYDEAKYELMLVCDDDNHLQPEYLKTVMDIYKTNPDIGLLGGYGIADFGEEKKPEWFDKWQHNYACGKHHEKSGFLKQGDVSIWGAGSVIRKTLWVFLRDNGFHFINNTGPGTMFGEDVELAHAVAYTGCKLYFDERLWFYHDLSGGRLKWENHKKHVKNSGSALFVIYDIAYKNSPKAIQWFYFLFIRMILILIIKLTFHSLKKHNKVMQTYLYNQLYEIIKHRKMYVKSYYKILPWISKIKNTFPIKGETL
jgi:glycosyltransferase involved in cell wall biosynthesis